MRALAIAATGMNAQQTNVEVIANNIANINTTVDEKGNISPFQRRFVNFLADQEKRSTHGRGVGVTFTVEVDRKAPPRKVYQPGHPHADADGHVAFPAIDLTKEFVNALEASRAYEANVATIDITKGMYNQALKILA